MKVKSIPATISVSLLALILVIDFSVPAAAQKTEKKEGSSKEMVSKKVDRKSNAPGKSGKDADYWFDKGALCATYGNDRAAIKYFQKVISLDPKRSGAYFEQGISYGQLGNFDKALALVNKALEMEPQNGLYLYGRARVNLLAGKQDQAMEDFKKAAELNDEDARDYLKHVAKQ